MKTKCPGTAQPAATKQIAGHAMAFCASCNRALGKHSAGMVAPLHYLKTATYGTSAGK